MHGVLEMCVLAVLDVAPLHAYGIVQRLHERGFANASFGSIYPLVTRLRKQGLVEQTLEPSQSGPARNVLAINAAGRSTLKAWISQWHNTTEVVTAVLNLHADVRTEDAHVEGRL